MFIYRLSCILLSGGFQFDVSYIIRFARNWINVETSTHHLSFLSQFSARASHLPWFVFDVIDHVFFCLFWNLNHGTVLVSIVFFLYLIPPAYDHCITN